jgi:RNA polymerase sigma-70 factor, ECF subfamily
MDKCAIESKIVELVKNKQTRKQGVSLLIDLYQEQLYWHIRKMIISHDDTKDVLQEVFLRVWKNIDRFKGDSKLSSWLYRIATNETIRFLDKKRGLLQNSSELEESLTKELESSDFINGDKIQMELQKAILKLPEKQRLAFNMRYFDEMKYEDIAEILETTVNSSKVSYYHAKTKIEQLMKEGILL